MVAAPGAIRITRHWADKAAGASERQGHRVPAQGRDDGGGMAYFFGAWLRSPVASAISLATPSGSSCWATWPPGNVRMVQPRDSAVRQPRSVFARSSIDWSLGTKAT